jgi:hypothetical protein
MFKCGACHNKLVQKRNEHGLLYHCAGCQNWLIDLVSLKAVVESPLWERFLLKLKAMVPGQGTPCPICSKPMNQLILETAADPLPVQACQTCEVVWMDTQEKNSLFPAPAPLELENQVELLPPEDHPLVKQSEATPSDDILPQEELSSKHSPHTPEPSAWEIIKKKMGFD